MLKDKILAYLREKSGRPLRIRDLARALKVPESDYHEFRNALKALVREGRVARLKGNTYGAPERFDMVTGHVSATPHGYVFVVPEHGEEDIFVPANATAGAMHNDIVQCRIVRKRPKGPEGKIERILKRANETVVGYLDHERNAWFVVPEDPKLFRDVVVDKGDLGSAEEGDLVVVRIDRWGSDHRNPSGTIIETLGDADDPEVEMTALVRKAGLAEEFPEAVEQAARQAAQSLKNEVRNRRDLRKETIFTIDPVDAKDFDDAVSVERRKGGGWRVGIHIADVSWFVRPGTPLDDEAFARGTSVYLVDRVIPMLPHALSSDACSLRPGEDRLVFSCFVELDAQGNPQKTELADSVIRSSARLTYEDAQTIIDSGNPPAGQEFPRKVVQDLLEMAKVSDALTARRRERGTIDFDLPEPIIVLDDEGVPVDLRERSRLASHRLVEEFMILANEAVARHAEMRGLPFIYRVHDAPDPERMEEFREFTATLGWTLPKIKETTPGVLADLLHKIEGEPAEPLINKVMLRHMRQALYSVDNLGHFGLASDSYAHFTSPIRRYPDLAIHRILRDYRDGPPKGRAAEELESTLRKTAEHASLRERAAMEAERESIKLKQVTYMEERVGDVLPGIISGVTSFGLFVELEDLLVDGLVHISELDDDFYKLDEKGYRLMGERTRRQYRLGDPVVVKVVRADRKSRQLDFVPATPEEIEQAGLKKE